MDEPVSLKISVVTRILLASSGFILCLLLMLAGCFSSAPRVSTTATSEAFSELAKNMARMRQLPFKRDVSFETVTKSSGTLLQIAAPAYYGALPLASLEHAYKTVGLLANDADLRSILTEYRPIEQQVAYDDALGRALLSTDLIRLGASLEKTNPQIAAELPAAFGIMTTLQEQHFKWQTKINSIALDDRRLAFRAIAAGDTLLTLVARAAGSTKGELSTAHLEVASQIAGEVDKLAARLPVFFRQQLSFPYRDGSQFVLWALGAKGWNGVNGLYANPPLSTAQILHPEKYFIQRELPLRFFPAALIRRFKESPEVEQSFGEYLIGGLLASEHAAKFAQDLAAAWRGDQLFTFQEGVNFTTVWFSSWKTENDAREFMHAYQSVLQASQRVRFERTTNGQALIGTTRDRRGWLLQAAGSVVLVVNTWSANHLIELADEAWKDLEIETESTVIPFESAKRRAQFSFRSK